jgi:hypothetical protein
MPSYSVTYVFSSDIRLSDLIDADNIEQAITKTNHDLYYDNECPFVEVVTPNSQGDEEKSFAVFRKDAVLYYGIHRIYEEEV